MKIRRIFFLINSLWELLRFMLVYLAALLVLRREFPVDPLAARWLLALAAPGLLLPAGFLFVYLDTDRREALLGLLRLGKVLALCAAAAVILTYPQELFGRGFAAMPAEILAPALLAGVLAVDVALLIALRPGRGAGGDETAR